MEKGRICSLGQLNWPNSESCLVSVEDEWARCVPSDAVSRGQLMTSNRPENVCDYNLVKYR